MYLNVITCVKVFNYATVKLHTVLLFIFVYAKSGLIGKSSKH